MLSKRFVILLALSVLLASPLSTLAQGAGPENSQVAMTLFQVSRGQDGKQYVVAKSGQPVYVPGLNIAPNASQIQVYRDGGNNFWYVDQNNRPTQVSQQQLQWVESQMQPHQQAPQQAQQPVTNNYYNTGGGGPSEMGTAAAAGMDAMAGAAMGSAASQSNYHGVPYGAPMYRAAAGGANANQMYYYNGGDQQSGGGRGGRDRSYAGNEQGSDRKQEGSGSEQGKGGRRGSRGERGDKESGGDDGERGRGRR